MTLCECGCQQETKGGNRFIRGHNGRIMSHETRKKLSEAAKGRKHTNETKKKIGKTSIGRKHLNKTKKKMSEAHRGKKLSPETRKKMSEAKLGTTLSEETRKKISKATLGKNLGNQHALGNKHSEETKHKLSGENASNWRGGTSFEPYCPRFNNSFRESIRDKFGRKCFLCGEEENGRKLAVHHVNYDKNCLCSDIKCEFVPLCMSCHSKTSNGDREYWENLIMKKLEGLA